MAEETITDKCPCGSGLPFEECCEPYLLGRAKAPTATALMRARYSAYAFGSVDFLYQSSGPRVRAEFDAEGCKRWSESSVWTGMEILKTEGGGEDDSEGTVEFIARYTSKQKDSGEFEHHEISQFKKIDGEWRFIDGEMIGPKPQTRETPKIGRNDPCPCGSGKKYKKCCGKDA